VTVKTWKVVVVLVAGASWMIMPMRAQSRSSTAARGVPNATSSENTNWSLHSLDLRNSRYSLLDEITPSNADKLTVAWSLPIDAKDLVAQMTPLVIDGIMYFNSGSKLFAVDAASGKSVWTLQVEPSFPGRNTRGPVYGDGIIYAAGQAVMYAVNAKTGKLEQSFGDKGLLRVVNKALEFRAPGKYPADLQSESLGYRMSSPPTYFNGMLYVGMADGDNLLPGSRMVALNGKTGAVKWVFTTVPQGPHDDGWEIAKDTWSHLRLGGGIWTQPAIDAELGRLYFNAANPTPDYDGTMRKGANLFSNSTIALNLETGKLAWYYQTVHHDLWDKDLPAGPLLFDINAGGKTIKAVAAAGKTCYLYIWDRETGQPINPMVETPVPTKTDMPGEEPWPTQPIPYTSYGVPQQPFCATYPIVADPELAKRVRPAFHPFLSQEAIIISPGLSGGANYGPLSFSPRTGLLYVTGKNSAYSHQVKVVGDTLKPGLGAPGHYGPIARVGDSGMIPTTNLAAYNALTGEQVWRTELPGVTSSGNFVTAGGVVFQGAGNGEFGAFDATTGRQLFKYPTRPIRASPLTYSVKGKQYVSVVATDVIVTFGLPSPLATAGSQSQR
jgi:glucose dehydrogenase